MKKRFLNALILGAVLLSTGAVTSCKDYDDDINNLQSQIDKLSQLESLKTDVATLQSAVSAAQSDATKALADAKAAADKADKAATAEQLKELQKALDAANELIAKKADKTEVKDLQEQLDALKKLVEEYKGDNATLSAAVAAQVKDLLEKSTLAADVTDLESRVEALEEKANQGGGDAEEINTLKAAYKALKEQAEKLGIAVSTMITDIQLYSKLAGVNDFNDALDFLYIAETADYNWYSDLNKGLTKLDDERVLPENDVKFKKGGAYFGSDSLLVRVSPATADLKAANVSFINSQGKSLDGIVEVADVHPYEGKLTQTTRANASATGLWVVKVKPATTTNEAGDEIVDIDAFKKAVYAKVEDGKAISWVSFAVAVKNFGDETAEDETRRVTSEYKVTADTKPAGRAGDFTVNGKAISDIHNRYMTCEDSQDGKAPTKTEKQEMGWSDNDATPSTSVLYDKDNLDDIKKTNVVLRDANDNRQGKAILAVEIGKDIVIDFTPRNIGEKDGKPLMSGDDVKGFFVVLDERNALESAPSEIIAWRSFSYTGVGYTNNEDVVQHATYFEGNKGAIRVNGLGKYEGDVIGFRVYAVNYDGTLVDPDGQAFYVVLGKEVSDNKNEYDVTYNGKGEFVSSMIDATAFLGEGYKNVSATGATGVTVVGKDAANKQLVFSMYFYGEDKKTVVGTFDAKDKAWVTPVTDWSKVSFVQLAINEPGLYVDGGKYTQEFYLTKGAAGTTVNVRKITVSVTKKMPEAPSYTFKSGQNEYQWLIPADFTVDANDIVNKGGNIDMNAILLENTAKGWAPLSVKTDHFKFTVKTSLWNADKKLYSDDATAEYKTGVDADKAWLYSISSNTENIVIANNTTSHAVSAVYSYYQISKFKDAKKGWLEKQNYTPAASSEDVKEFIYCSWTKDFKTDASKWEPYAEIGSNGKPTGKTITNNELYWNGSPDVQQLNLKYVAVSSDLRGLANSAILFKGKSLGELIASKYLMIVPNTLKLNGSKGDEDKYFEVTAVSDVVENADHKFVTVINCKKISTMQSPLEHTETLSFNVRDCFGNVIPVALKVTVKP